jgi:molybdopterin-synthase adenylyltransferase
MILTDAQLERYARHILLKEIGGAGQMRLLGAQVVIIGAGGIGCPAIAYLAAAGIGTLRVIDPDVVALSNLQRQILFSADNIGQPKPEVARQAALRINPNCHLIPINSRIDVGNAERLLRGADLVLDGCDNFTTRLIVSDAATGARVPLISAAVGGFTGQIGHWRGWEDGQPCYRCLLGDDPGAEGRDCSSEGVLGALTGIIGTMAALEVVRALVPFGESLRGQMMMFDALTHRQRVVRVAADPACPACATQTAPA